MDDEAHVGFVDAHAEGVRGGDHFKLAADEALLDAFLGFGLELGVKVLRREPFFPEEPGHGLGLVAGGAVDDGAARFAWRKSGRKDLVDVGEFGAWRSGNNGKLQVGPPCPAVEELQVNAHLALEVAEDVRHDVGLGRGGQAHDRRGLPLPCPFPDETAHVAVIGAEIVAPGGEAVGLVDDPGPDLALGQGLAQGRAPELLRRDEENSHVAQAHPVQGVGPFRHGQKAVDRR